MLVQNLSSGAIDVSATAHEQLSGRRPGLRFGTSQKILQNGLQHLGRKIVEASGGFRHGRQSQRKSRERQEPELTGGAICAASVANEHTGQQTIHMVVTENREKKRITKLKNEDGPVPDYTFLLCLDFLLLRSMFDFIRLASRKSFWSSPSNSSSSAKRPGQLNSLT